MFTLLYQAFSCRLSYQVYEYHTLSVRIQQYFGVVGRIRKPCNHCWTCWETYTGKTWMHERDGTGRRWRPRNKLMPGWWRCRKRSWLLCRRHTLSSWEHWWLVCLNTVNQPRVFPVLLRSIQRRSCGRITLRGSRPLCEQIPFLKLSMLRCSWLHSLLPCINSWTLWRGNRCHPFEVMIFLWPRYGNSWRNSLTRNNLLSKRGTNFGP